MVKNYTQMRMEIQAFYNCGLFFIETGTPSAFGKWIDNSNRRMSKYVPKVLIERIKGFIEKEDRNSAATLWLRVCEHIIYKKQTVWFRIGLRLAVLIGISIFLTAVIQLMIH
jgi:hypothetical protein